MDEPKEGKHYNKGEWSELYVFLRLLDEGRVYAANANLEKIDDVYYPIVQIERQEKDEPRYEYAVVDTDIEIRENPPSDVSPRVVPRSEMERQADSLYEGITEKDEAIKGKVADFVKDIGVHKVKAASNEKIDIQLRTQNIFTNSEQDMGFSIKSFIGARPTLLNASRDTIFEYRVKGLSPELIDEINSIEGSSWVKRRVVKTRQSGEIVYSRMMNETFERNLSMIDTKMPELLSYALQYAYSEGNSATDCRQTLKLLREKNPLRFKDVDLYEYKFKKFLCASALGMVPSEKWDGHDEANGGYIVVKGNGELVLFPLARSRDEFEQYLLDHTKFETPSSSRYSIANLEWRDGGVFMKLTLQIRFK